MSWGRAQKYHRRQRFLYALLWNGGSRVYVGQTVDTVRREQQHRKAWSQPFVFRVLGSMEGTQSQGEDWEYAWRLVAWRAGCEVVAKTVGGTAFTVRNPRRRMNALRYQIATRCKWPIVGERKRVRWGTQLAGLAGSHPCHCVLYLDVD